MGFATLFLLLLLACFAVTEICRAQNCKQNQFIHQLRCKDCPLGWIGNKNSQLDCDHCQTGRTSNQGRRQNARCVVLEERVRWGSARIVRQESSQVSAGQSSCSICSSGRYAKSTGQKACTQSAPRATLGARMTRRAQSAKHVRAEDTLPMVVT